MTSQGARPDPGWGRPLRRFLPFIIIPVLVVKRSSSDEQRIVQLRTAFLAFVGALFALLAVLAVLFPFTTDGPVDPVVYALVAIGPATWAAIPWTRNKLLGFCGPPSQLAGAYVTGLFINIAFIESAALFGFVAAFLADALWPYAVGMAVALVGFAAIAPTAQRIRDLDERLSTRGCAHSLRTGLYATSDGDE